MTLYDDMMQGVIDVHCHIDFEFSAKERKREPEFLWLPKAEAMGMRGVVLKSHWWPTINVVPYILASVQTKVALWSSVALNITADGPNPCVVEACAELGGKMVFLPTWSARNDVERKGFSDRIKSYYKSCSIRKSELLLSRRQRETHKPRPGTHRVLKSARSHPRHGPCLVARIPRIHRSGARDGIQ